MLGGVAQALMALGNNWIRIQDSGFRGWKSRDRGHGKFRIMNWSAPSWHCLHDCQPPAHAAGFTVMVTGLLRVKSSLVSDGIFTCWP